MTSVGTYHTIPSTATNFNNDTKSAAYFQIIANNY